ncbi:response regulator [Ancylobacter lacus]|nr:response regulator [Ancylobacter lacus]
MLICDDEIDLAQELGEFFANEGWEVEVCVSGTQAIRLLQGGLAPQVLLTDLRIGTFNGVEVVAAARQLPAGSRPAVTVILTGHVVGSAVAADFACDLLYAKPVDPDLLLREVVSLLALRKACAERGA